MTNRMVALPSTTNPTPLHETFIVAHHQLTLDAVMPAWFTQGMGINFYFGGTSLLIVVGVAMDFVQQVESQLVMRNYEGFMKRGRVRGRR